ncbi:doublecortin domain-containing protein 2-like [Megalops cyprinoides]|uniref:doublecortin domain-containing protein 2-like n=1 Tax=Megalops cyprinoides TaxID=118141 RepID=UPI0018642521|nr:doublecortin domain-containing protein 2-like [Megalops cyprinoides]
MHSDKPNFLSQPVVKNVFMYRNGDPYYEGRRLVINEKRVSNFETFLKEVTNGVQPAFGAVRNIYTPKAGHRVSSLEHLHSGEQYVAAGKEKFKKLDYSQIGTKKKKVSQNNSVQVKPVPQSRIVVSARFLKPIKEPCAIFIVANGDVLSPAVRLLIPPRVLCQFERVLEMITERMGLRILGGVRSLYTLDGTAISDGKELENGQFYVAVGREKFKKLPYSELILTKPAAVRRFIGSKAASLPPIYRFRKQNGNSKSMVSCSESGDPKTSPPAQAKEQLSSIVSELSQARLMKLRQKKSGLTMTLGDQNNGEGEPEDPGESGDQPDNPSSKGAKATPPTEEKQAEEVAEGSDPKETTEETPPDTGSGVDTTPEERKGLTEAGTGDSAPSSAVSEKGEEDEGGNEDPTPAPRAKEEKSEGRHDPTLAADTTEETKEKNEPAPAPDRKEETNEKNDLTPTLDTKEEGDSGSKEAGEKLEDGRDEKPNDDEPETKYNKGETSGGGEGKKEPAEGADADQARETVEGEEKAGSSGDAKTETMEEEESVEKMTDGVQAESGNGKGGEQNGGGDAN